MIQIVLMANYTSEVNVIHKKDRERLLKKHLREETTMINKAKKKLE